LPISLNETSLRFGTVQSILKFALAIPLNLTVSIKKHQVMSFCPRATIYPRRGIGNQADRFDKKKKCLGVGAAILL